MTQAEKKYALSRIEDTAHEKINSIRGEKFIPKGRKTSHPTLGEVLEGIKSGKFKLVINKFNAAETELADRYDSYSGQALSRFEIKGLPDKPKESDQGLSKFRQQQDKRIAKVQAEARSITDQIMLGKDGEHLLKMIANFAAKKF